MIFERPSAMDEPQGQGADARADAAIDAAPTSPRRWRRRVITIKESGYVMIMTAILLPVLLMFMALAVDVAVYYFRGVQLQRAADASALSGVIRMPRFSSAAGVARFVATKNGFTDGEDSVDVRPTKFDKNDRRLKVTITDNNVPLFFGRLIRSSWSITKTATAEYVSSIPLGSKENAIGTGYLSDSGDKQKFWLAASGPCAAKESGDLKLARYDGNAVNTRQWADLAGSAANNNPDGQLSMLCDWDVTGTAQGTTQLKNERTAKQANPLLATLYPAMSANYDYDKDGYNLIVDTPCFSGATPAPPPCESSAGAQSLPGDLVIQMYDPVFNPDSIQRRFQTVVNGPTVDPLTGSPKPDSAAAPRFVDERSDLLKPDKFGVNLSATVSGCAATPPANLTLCNNAAAWGDKNQAPANVHVTTDVRVYPPDLTPLDYADDVTMPLAGGTDLVSAPETNVVDNADVNKVKRYGSCVRWTDDWIAADATRSAFKSVPPLSAAQPTVAGVMTDGAFIKDAITYVDPAPANVDQCNRTANKWVTVARTAAASSPVRGRYRLNIRTISAQASFGSNAYAVRAFFVPSNTPANAENAAYPACFLNRTCTNSPASTVWAAGYQPVSVSGDSNISVSADVARPINFYLAKLSPAALYRNKTVLVHLWDPGEGADKLQILVPRNPSDNCIDKLGADLKDTDDPTNYCVQKFEWKVEGPGIREYADPNSALTNIAAPMADVCEGKGLPKAATSDPLPVFLQVSGSENSIEDCANPQLNEIVRSRAYYTKQAVPTDDIRKFNDRKVVVRIKVPSSYGCAWGTGVYDSVNMVDIPCTEEDPPQGGWWKIKYIPRLDLVNGGYKNMTDRTTWSVDLQGDPVHLVVDGG